MSILDSQVSCVNLEDLARYYKLKHLQVRNSKLKDVLCPLKTSKLRSITNNLKHIKSLDVSFNSLVQLDSVLESSVLLESLNIAHNRFNQISPVITTFKKLRSLNISNNMLSITLDRQIFESIAPNLQQLDLSGLNNS